MRIITWNCARGPWSLKNRALDTLRSDIAVITEAPRAVADFGLPWFGQPSARNGKTIVTAPDYSVEIIPTVEGAPCVTPVRITGPQSFTLLAIWTWPAAPYKNYREPLLAGLRAYRRLPPPFVIAGDFNGNTSFDKRPKSRIKWSHCFAAVEEFGVVSAYHNFFGAAYGAETHPTQYQTRNANKPFHLDYVFVPTAWRGAIRGVCVPPYEEFALSDHRPVIVDLDLPQLPNTR